MSSAYSNTNNFNNTTSNRINLKVNSCLSDIRRWMITNKLKINDSKAEFIVFRSPQLGCDLSGLSVKVRLRNY